jgi:hypothetical protein
MLTRILRMSLDEVADRGRQEASKWIDRTALAWPRENASLLPTADDDFEARAALERFRRTATPRFFTGAIDARVPSLLPFADRERALAAAKGVRCRRFDLLGHTALSFGDPVDWRLDPLSGRKSPLVHWSVLDPLDPAAAGDVKVVWELNRQQYLVTLGTAYAISRDERNAEAFAGLIRAWLKDNPPGLGINWASSLEVALRAISWCWALFLFRDSPHLTPGLFRDIALGIDAHAAHIERYLSRHSSPNTHLTGEGLGLFYAGTLFPDSAAAERRRSLGQAILDREIQRQVLSDGVYFEQATAYQMYTVEIYLHYLLLAARNGLAVSAEVGAGVQRMLDALLSLREPGGKIPALGDQDGGCLLPLGRREPDDARGLFAVAAAAFGRSDFAWAADGLQPEALWLAGPDAAEALASANAAPPAHTSRVFDTGGYVVMRSGWDTTAHHLVFDVGPLGCPLTGAHGHADLLSVVVSAFGESFVVDPGTYVYAAEPLFRDHFRGTASHSTVTVDGRGQAEPSGPFGWRDRPAARLRRFLCTPAFDFADANHGAYERLPDPVTHRRRVVFVKSPGYFVIVDDLTGSAVHRIEQRFQFADLPLTASPDGWVDARSPHGRGLLVRAFSNQALETRIDSGSLEPIAGWISPNYGRRIPAPSLVFSATAALPLRILTLLLPALGERAAPPRVSSIADMNHAPAGLVFEDTNATLLIDEDTVYLKDAPPCR